MNSSSGSADEDEVLYGVLLQEVDEGCVVDAAVEAAEDEGVDTAEGSYGGDGGGGDGGDAVVVLCDTFIHSDLLHAVP